MVRLDLTIFKYLTIEDFRVLIAIELGMRNHEWVPVDLIESIAKIKRVNVYKLIQNLLKNKLIQRNGQKYEGYSLNYLGYDFLAIRVLVKKGILVKILSRMGVGKESDVFYCLINKNAGKDLSEEEIAKVQMNLLAEDLEKVEEDDEDINEDDEEEEKDDIEEDENENNNEDNEDIVDKFGNYKEKIKFKPKETKESKEKDINIDNIEENEGISDKDFNYNTKNEEFLISNYYENYNQLMQIDLNQNKVQLVSGILKLARLGRTSFRTVKTKRDFVKNKSHYNWLYLSRLSSETEYKFLVGLHNNNFPVPKPYGHSRHAIIMEYVPSYQLSRVNDIKNPEVVYNSLNQLIYSLAEVGLVHGDFNEFNVLISKEEKITIIDFTQMISIDHKNAETYFTRDLKGVKNYFKKKFCLSFINDKEAEEISFEEIKKRRSDYLDVKLNAFGSIKKLNRTDLEEISTDNINDDMKIHNDLLDDDLLKDLNEVNIKGGKVNVNDIDINDDDGLLLDDKIDINLDDVNINMNTTTNNDDIVITKRDIMKKVMKGMNKEYKQQNKFKGKPSKSNRSKNNSKSILD